MSRNYTKRTLEEQHQRWEDKKQKMNTKIARLRNIVETIADRQQRIAIRITKRKPAEVQPNA